MQEEKNRVTQVVSYQGYPGLKGYLFGQSRSGFLSSLASSCATQMAIQLLKMELFEMGFKPPEDFSIHSPKSKELDFKEYFLSSQNALTSIFYGSEYKVSQPVDRLSVTACFRFGLWFWAVTCLVINASLPSQTWPSCLPVLSWAVGI